MIGPQRETGSTGPQGAQGDTGPAGLTTGFGSFAASDTAGNPGDLIDADDFTVSGHCSSTGNTDDITLHEKDGQFPTVVSSTAAPSGYVGYTYFITSSGRLLVAQVVNADKTAAATLIISLVRNSDSQTTCTEAVTYSGSDAGATSRTGRAGRVSAAQAAPRVEPLYSEPARGRCGHAAAAGPAVGVAACRGGVMVVALGGGRR